jgi:hypothetical protein
MTRRVFISFEHPEQLGPSGFDIDAHHDLNLHGRHLADPDRRDDPAYIREQLSRSSVTVVLFGTHAAESESVARDIAWSLEGGNGLVGIRLDPAASPPEMLHEAGAEILDWSEPADVTYLRSAIEAAARSAALLRRAAKRGTGSGESCARPTARFPH